jgi:hypothetical protein
MTSSHSSTSDTIYTHPISKLLHNFDYHQSKQFSWEVFSTLSRQYVEIEGFLYIFNDCYCSTIIEDGEKPFYLLSNSLYPPGFFVQIMNDSIGTGRTIDCLKKETSLEFTFNSLLGGDFLLTQHRNSACWNTKIFREGLFCNPCPYHDMDWLPYRWVEPFCIFNKNRVSLYARAGVLSSKSFSLP